MTIIFFIHCIVVVNFIRFKLLNLLLCNNVNYNVEYINTQFTIYAIINILIVNIVSVVPYYNYSELMTYVH